MKPLLITLCLALAAFAQPSKTSLSGGSFFNAPLVRFEGEFSLNIGPSTDTLSDIIVIENNGIRPLQLMALEYTAIADNSSASSFSMEFWTRTCSDPNTSLGCPNQWVKPAFRRIYDTERIADTITVALVPEDSTAFSHLMLLPTGNQVRLRVVGGSADSVRMATGIYLRGM